MCIAAGMVLGKDSLPIGGLQETDETASATAGKGAHGNKATERLPARSEWNLTREDKSNGAPPSGSGNRKIASDQGREPSGVHNETESVAGAITGTECVIDWSEFKEESLKSIDLRETKEQRTEEDVAKLARFAIKYKHLMSDGTLDFSTHPDVKHDTTAKISTTTENPKIVARGTRCNPDETKAYMKAIGDERGKG